MSFTHNTIKKAKRLNKVIVFPEAEDIRILQAVRKLHKKKIIKPLLIGNPDIIIKIAEKDGIALKNIDIIFPDEAPGLEEHEAELFELLKTKGVTKRQISSLILEPVIYGALLVRMGFADGIVSGATHPSSDTISTALRIIGLRKGVKTASSMFFMERKKELLAYSDCGFVIEPDEKQLADITIETCKTARLFGMEPRVAMLSFSTKGSANHERVKKVSQATKIVQKREPELTIDGEFQFDSAIIPDIRARKAPESPLGDKPANVLIFPDLDSGNIAYKITERLAGFNAYGPILQGFAKPINDLSRGCSVEDIVVVAAITAVQTNQES